LLVLDNGKGIVGGAFRLACTIGLVDIGHCMQVSRVAYMKPQHETFVLSAQSSVLTSVIVGARILVRAICLAESVRVLPEGRHESQW
jgi:hypothetical protein